MHFVMRMMGLQVEHEWHPVPPFCSSVMILLSESIVASMQQLTLQSIISFSITTRTWTAGIIMLMSSSPVHCSHPLPLLESNIHRLYCIGTKAMQISIRIPLGPSGSPIFPQINLKSATISQLMDVVNQYLQSLWRTFVSLSWLLDF